MEGGMEKALQYYKRAITLDPDYAPAYSAIAEWYWFLPFMGQEASKEDVYPKAKEAITKALEIDQNFAEAHATLAIIRLWYEWDWKGAEKAFETALNLNPGSSKSHYDYAVHLAWVVGNADKAIMEARKAVELDPLSGNAHNSLGQGLLVSGQFDQAIEQFRIAREMIPKHLPCIYGLVFAYREKGMLEEALGEIKKGLGLFPKEPWLLGSMGSMYTLTGEKEKARAILDELLERSKKEYVPPMFIALLYADLGEIDQAFEYLEKGYEKRDIWFSFIKSMPLSRLLGTDPRFISLLKKMGLED
jgi:adenylate cyclase